MKNIYFNGRADGLGNRIEELIHLEYHCIVNKTKCFYFWNNNNWRKYDLLIKCENIILQKDKFLDIMEITSISIFFVIHVIYISKKSKKIVIHLLFKNLF